MPVIIVLAGGCGLVMQISSSGGSPLHSLCMFTTLSNIYVFLYYVMSLASSGHGVAKMFCPAWRFSAMISITLTGLVAVFMLGGIFAAAALGHGFGMGGSSYPYPFMDIDKLGVSRVALICSALALALAGLSALLVFADRHMASRRK